ncbi:hypothetical protein [Mycolicibacterium thermoresistibile]
MVEAILSWWDGVELWLSGLGFVAQTAVVMPVVLALAFGTAVLLDVALRYGIRGIRVLRESPLVRRAAVEEQERS